MSDSSVDFLTDWVYLPRMKSTASRIRAAIADSGERFWRIADFEGSPMAIEKTLSRLTAEGELRRVRHGLYWRGADTLLGMAPPTPNHLVSELTDARGVGPSGLSAAAALGLTMQIPKRHHIAVAGPIPRATADIKFVTRSSHFRRDARLNASEVALLEVLREWRNVVDLSDSAAISRIREVINHGDINMDRVVRAARTEPARTRHRLRWLLSEMGDAERASRVPPPRASKPEVLLAS